MSFTIGFYFKGTIGHENVLGYFGFTIKHSSPLTSVEIPIKSVLNVVDGTENYTCKKSYRYVLLRLKDIAHGYTVFREIKLVIGHDTTFKHSYV